MTPIHPSSVSFSQHPFLEPLGLPAPVGGPRQVPPEGVQPESPAEAAQEEAGEPGLKIAGFVRDRTHLLSPRNERIIFPPTFPNVSGEMKYAASFDRRLLSVSLGMMFIQVLLNTLTLPYVKLFPTYVNKP